MLALPDGDNESWYDIVINLLYIISIVQTQYTVDSMVYNRDCYQMSLTSIMDNVI